MNIGNNQRRSGVDWKHTTAIKCIPILAAGLMVFVGCATQSATGRVDEHGDSGRQGQEGSRHPSVAKPEKDFNQPTELDVLLDGKPMALGSVRSSDGIAPTPSGSSAKSTTSGVQQVSPSKARFRIQLSAEADYDSAQKRKADLEKVLGSAVDVVFDAPYYKLRWGYFNSKQDAEDKMLELTEFNIQGFVVKN